MRPDVMVALGMAPRVRWSYRARAEGKLPDSVLEVESPGGWGPSWNWPSKHRRYQRLGVPEFFLFEPMYCDPGLDGKLRGFRRLDGACAPIRPEGKAGESSELRSEALGLTIWPENKRLRLRDERTGEILERHEEVQVARAAEAKRRKPAEARVAELESRLRALDPGL